VREELLPNPMRTKHLCLAVLVSLAALLATGCGTTSTIVNGIRDPYAGTKLDTFILDSPNATMPERIGAFVDFPFSLAADIAITMFCRPVDAEQVMSPEYR
jgi:hypothetical protein